MADPLTDLAQDGYILDTKRANDNVILHWLVTTLNYQKLLTDFVQWPTNQSPQVACHPLSKEEPWQQQELNG